MGYIPSVSIIPSEFCKSMPCYHEGCYAVALCNRYPNTKNAWQRNWDLYLNSSDIFFSAIDRFLEIAAPRYFRWHVGGEIPDKEYLKNVLRLADKHRTCRFLLYTKQYNLLYGINNIPANIEILMSIWNGLNYPSDLNFRKASTGIEVENAIHCAGYCPDCRACWNSKKNILFDFE